MQKHTSLTTQYDESLEMLAHLVQKGHQLHDQAIFDAGAWLMSWSARLLKKAVGMDTKHDGNPITVKHCL